jgi:hypothetical protein
MRGTFQIINERVESFTGKRGKVEQRVISLLDQDTSSPMLNTVDYVLSDDEKGKYSGKCQGKKIELAINDLKFMFGGRVRLQGHVQSVS